MCVAHLSWRSHGPSLRADRQTLSLGACTITSHIIPPHHCHCEHRTHVCRPPVLEVTRAEPAGRQTDAQSRCMYHHITYYHTTPLSLRAQNTCVSPTCLGGHTGLACGQTDRRSV